MSDRSIETIKERLKELEGEKKKLLTDLALLQSQQNVDEAVCSPIGHRVAPSTPVTPNEKVDLFLKLFGLGGLSFFPFSRSSNKANISVTTSLEAFLSSRYA